MRTVLALATILCAVAAPAGAVSVQKAFDPDQIPAGGTTTLRFTFVTANGENARADVGLTDMLPSGLVIAPGGVGGTCANAAAATIASQGGSSVSIFNLQVPAGAATCSVTVPITNKAGSFNESCGALPAAFTNDASRVTLTNASGAIVASCLEVDNVIFADQFE